MDSSKPLKRPQSPTAGVPPSKRVNITPTSSKASIRDATEALMKKTNEMEDLLATREAEIEAKQAGTLRQVYIVTEEMNCDNRTTLNEMLGVYSAIEDANRKVRNHCADIAGRDDPDALFREGITGDGRIWWSWMSEESDDVSVQILKETLQAPGSEPIQDWGRDIGVPCPPKED